MATHGIVNEVGQSRSRATLRRAVRFACAVDVDGVGTVEGVATDLSARGLWLALETPLEMGVLVTVHIRLPRTGRLLDVVAEVARVDANAFGFGMGLRFHLTPSDESDLDAALHGLPPRLPRTDPSTLVEPIVEIGDDATDVVLGDDE